MSGLGIWWRQALEDFYGISVQILDKDITPDPSLTWLRDLLNRFLLDGEQSRVELSRIDNKAEVHLIPVGYYLYIRPVERDHISRTNGLKECDIGRTGCDLHVEQVRIKLCRPFRVFYQLCQMVQTVGGYHG